MKTKLIETGNGFNWGRFMVGIMDTEWERLPAAPEANFGRPVLRECGWNPQRNVLVLDLVTREGAVFGHGGYAPDDLRKHKIWVCPMFEPFLKWLYDVPWEKVAALELPDYVQFDIHDAPADMHGYRRPGAGWRERIAALDETPEPEEKKL